MKLHMFTVASNAQAGRLYAYARRMLPDVPEYAIREAFQKRDVKVDGQRVGMNAMLVPGAEVRIYTRDLEVRAVDIPVVYEDENVLAAVKPAGISCEADAKGGKTLSQLLHAQMLKADPDAKEPLLCHRLDNPTSGVIVLAKDESVQLELQDAFRNRQIHKEYTCLVRGTPEKKHQVLTHWLIKDAAKARVRVLAEERPGAKKIITEYSVLEAGETSRLLIRLHTGRTHQIRAHMAYIGHPLLGDDEYGDREYNRSHKCRKLMLCSTRLTFSLEGRLSYLNDKEFTCKPAF